MTDPTPFRAFTSVLPWEFSPMMGHLEYTGWRDEQLSWKTTCYVGDWTFVPQIRVKGPDAVRLFSDLSVNSFTSHAVGRAKHCVMCNEDGKVITEGILFRHAEDDFEFEAASAWVWYHIKTGGYDVDVSFPVTHKLQVSGPTALPLLEELSRTTLRDVRFMHTKVLSIVGHEVTALRQGMAGEIGFELHGPIEQHDLILDAVLKAGEKHGIRRLGRRTFHLNHIEASYPTTGMEYWNALNDERREDFHRFIQENPPPEWTAMPGWQWWGVSLAASLLGSWDGDDLTDLYRSPVELGWANRIAFDHDFIGRDALERELANPGRTIATLEFNSEDVIRIYASLFEEGESLLPLDIPHPPYITGWADWIFDGDKKIGHSTFPGYSYFFKKVLALAFIDNEHNRVGREVEILWGNPHERQTKIRATIKPAPYKADNRRMDLQAPPAG
ncbi:hypothetical protein K0817_005620 [Microbacterium sp. HD4P20]|uniref:glycine cleavage T C-terminal barrel domain-containing protein n=1 Tax=Microbacterium sp. HD4P20 TaxID=2864874 RepID=UPI0020A5D46C|nr:glycine cleavage T C-terminal barrel domain-containing protein [Microbacterium sp. HD4P20]MCP2636046.1 hypothetical protein [Microbacterium sp. HD4P20]